MNVDIEVPAYSAPQTGDGGIAIETPDSIATHVGEPVDVAPSAVIQGAEYQGTTSGDQYGPLPPGREQRTDQYSGSPYYVRMDYHLHLFVPRADSTQGDYNRYTVILPSATRRR